MDSASNMRSCYRCNQKKIRCTKTHPCGSCLRSGSECAFPGPGRAPRRKKRPLKAQLVSHMKSLEEEVQSLTRQLEAVNRTPLPLSPAAETARGVKHEHGTLLTDEESTQYVTHEVLVNLGIQNSEDGNQFLFGYSSLTVSLSDFHPPMAHRHVLWKVFEENVAPVVMIFHKPSIRTIMTSTTGSGSGTDRASGAVLFAIYFAAVTSMHPEQCAEMLGQDHHSLRQRYRFATQQALPRANFLESQNLADMTASVHRMAQGLGLHRDGAHFDLSPFEIEMRRRLWWSIYLLDSRSSEFRGVGTQITEHSYDTRLPLNINDSDISPDSAQAPEERVGFTDMTFCLVRCEMTVLYRRSCLNAYNTTSSSSEGGHTSHHSEQRVHKLEQIHNQLRERFLQFCDVSIPVQWVTATVIRLALARSWLLAHLPDGTTAEQIPLTGISSLEDTKREQLFSTAIEVLEFAYLLETDSRTKQWSWLFEGYPQWHAAVVVLTELRVRPQTMLAGRAWAVTVKAVTRWTSTDWRKGELIPKIVSLLMERAAAAHGYNWDGTRSQYSAGSSPTGSLESDNHTPNPS
ncbi:C6 transcription factor [Aspergillus floccosus]